MNAIRRFVLAAVLIAAGVFVARPQTADAATCYGPSCRGLDPQATSCDDDAYGVGSATFLKGGSIIGSIHRYYSPTCAAYFGIIIYNVQPYDFSTALSIYMEQNAAITLVNGDTAALRSKMWTSGRTCGTMKGISNCA